MKKFLVEERQPFGVVHNTSNYKTANVTDEGFKSKSLGATTVVKDYQFASSMPSKPSKVDVNSHCNDPFYWTRKK